MNEESAVETERIYNFLKTFLRRKIQTEVVAKIADDRIETEFCRIVEFCNLFRTLQGLSVDAMVSIKQRNYDLDDMGNRTGSNPVVRDRDLALRYEMQEMRSTGKLIGIERLLTSTRTNSLPLAKSARMNLDKDQLIITVSTILYDDQDDRYGEIRVGAAMITHEYRIKDGKLQCRSEDLGFAVDPVTLGRTPTGIPIVLNSHEVIVEA